MDTIEIRYTGPADVVNRDVGRETGSDRLEPGETITVSAELGARLLRSGGFEDPELSKMKREDLAKLAKTANLDVADDATKEDLRSAIAHGRATAANAEVGTEADVDTADGVTNSTAGNAGDAGSMVSGATPGTSTGAGV